MSNNGTGFWLTVALIAALSIAMLVEAAIRLIFPVMSGRRSRSLRGRPPCPPA